MPEKPFTVDTYPTRELPVSIFAAARSYIECNYVRVGLYAGKMITANSEFQYYVTCPLDKQDDMIAATKRSVEAKFERKGEPTPAIEVTDMTLRMLAHQQEADMEYVDYQMHQMLAEGR